MKSSKVGDLKDQLMKFNETVMIKQTAQQKTTNSTE